MRNSDKMSWMPFKIGQPKKQIVSKTVERDVEREYNKLQKLEDQIKKLHKDMKKSTEADIGTLRLCLCVSGRNEGSRLYRTTRGYSPK
nr:bridging integrator 3-like isoform X1 [Oncorhynchus nerka]